jgi:hypothetical protein
MGETPMLLLSRRKRHAPERGLKRSAHICEFNDDKRW